MNYWMVVSKRHKKLWKPRTKHDFYDTMYDTKENAESCIVYPEYWMAIQVKVVKI